jgi:hypothetical protein
MCRRGRENEKLILGFLDGGCVVTKEDDGMNITYVTLTALERHCPLKMDDVESGQWGGRGRWWCEMVW